MKKTLLLLALFLASFATCSAKWEMVYELNAAYGFFITKDGTMLISNYDSYFDDGGIFVSDDNGATWTKTNATDHYYNEYFEADGHVFAAGYGANIARSDDGGHTWKVINYGSALKGLPHATSDNISGTACYGITSHDGRLYAADYMYGVIASDDWGETWSPVDPDGLSYETEGKDGKGGKAIENLYKISEYNGTLLAHGLYKLYAFDDATGKWKALRNSNNMAVYTVFNGELFTGCSMPNESMSTPFLYRTTDLRKWTNVGHPDGVLDTNVRALASDDCRIYAALQYGGVYMTSDCGKTWHFISDGLPRVYNEWEEKYEDYFISTLQVVPTKDYLYALMYNEPWNVDQHSSGLYRISMDELEEVDPTGIGAILATSAAPAPSLYSLDGRRAKAGQKGCFIEGGELRIKN